MASDGKPLRCFKCQSIFHLKEDCDKVQKKKADSKVEGTALSEVLLRARGVEFNMFVLCYDNKDKEINKERELVLVSSAENAC